MSTTTIYFDLYINGVLTDATSVVFRNPDATFGVRRTDTLATVVAVGTSLSRISTGRYQYAITDPAPNLTYNYWIEWEYNGDPFWAEQNISGGAGADTPPTVGGVGIESYVRLVVGDNNSDDYEFSNSDLLLLFDYAIRQYQEYRQYTLTQTFTTVAEQKDYALPSSCLKVLSHTYRTLPGISSDTFVAYYNAVSGYPVFVPYSDYTDVVMNRIRQEFYRRVDELGAGQAGVIDYQTSYTATKYLRIFPTPTTSGETFTVTYTANHPVQSNDYFTIPAADAIHVRKLLQAQVLEARLAKMASTANEFASGTTRTKFERSMDMLERQIGDLRQQVHDALTSPQSTRG